MVIWVGVGDGAALSDTDQSRVALEGAVGDFDLAVGAVPRPAPPLPALLPSKVEPVMVMVPGIPVLPIRSARHRRRSSARRVALEGAVGDGDGTIG